MVIFTNMFLPKKDIATQIQCCGHKMHTVADRKHLSQVEKGEDSVYMYIKHLRDRSFATSFKD